MARIASSVSVTVSLVVTAIFVSSPADARQPATPHESEALEIYRTIVSYPTYEGAGKVPEMARYLAGKFRGAGFSDADIHIIPVGETAAMVVRYRGDGSGGRPILLLAHMDVVTANREDWERDPFKLVEENGFFFGRGSSDDKAGVAGLTATFLRLKQEKFVPRRDLIIFFSGDEETEAKSVEAVIKEHRELIDAEFAFNADAGGGLLNESDAKPRLFLVQGAEKTYADFELTVRNPGGHSSRPRTDNAIYELADVLGKLQAYRFPVMSGEWTLQNLAAASKTVPGRVGEALREFVANPVEGPAADVLNSEPEYVGLTRTTCVATMLKGGHAENALPQSAMANVNCRIFPGTSIESVQATLQELAGPATSIKVIDDPFASDASPMRKDVMASITRVVHKRYPGLPLVPYMSAGATDGKYFRAAGIPVYGVIFLFAKESEEFAHGLNERTRVDQFYNSLEDWHALLEDVAGKKTKSR
ncbi:MAG TPA: M20/M25/M40 family metallo-hydrolase [Steroidobacteraceae bacterium]|nr:M20/M25/M40 family metallo-hydrolase [Steroidobacteraceae bacterium]